MIKTALIFAAGRGERLKPITNSCPKALCMVGQHPLIEHHVLRLAAAGFQHILINHAYLGGLIRQYLGHGDRYAVKITYLPEPPGALETGGAIIQALPYLGEDPFLTVSADIWTDYPFDQLTLPSTSAAHLVLAPLPAYIKQGDFDLTSTGHISNLSPSYTFANIACFDPALFKPLPYGRIPLGVLLHNWLRTQQITGEIYTGQWINIGTPTELITANQQTL